MSTRIFAILIILSALNTFNAVNATHTLKVHTFNKSNQCVAPWVNLTKPTNVVKSTQGTHTTEQIITKRADSFTKSYMKRTFYNYLDLSITYAILVHVLQFSPATFMTIQLAMLWVEFDDIRTLLALAINK